MVHRQNSFRFEMMKGCIITKTNTRRYARRIRGSFLSILTGVFLIEMLPPAFAQPTLPDVSSGGSEYALNESHSRIAFSIGHFFVSSTQGQFMAFDGRLGFDPQTPEHGSVVVRIYPSSISTGIAARDEHLRNADFFDAAKYPSAIFQSKAIVKDTNTTGKLVGVLSLHGITKPVTLNVTLLSPDLHADRLDFSAVGTLKRSDYGMTNYEGVIGDEVSLNIEAEFDRKR